MQSCFLLPVCFVTSIYKHEHNAKVFPRQQLHIKHIRKKEKKKHDTYCNAPVQQLHISYRSVLIQRQTQSVCRSSPTVHSTMINAKRYLCKHIHKQTFTVEEKHTKHLEVTERATQNNTSPNITNAILCSQFFLLNPNYFNIKQNFTFYIWKETELCIKLC